MDAEAGPSTAPRQSAGVERTNELVGMASNDARSEPSGGESSSSTKLDSNGGPSTSTSTRNALPQATGMIKVSNPPSVGNDSGNQTQMPPISPRALGKKRSIEGEQRDNGAGANGMPRVQLDGRSHARLFDESSHTSTRSSAPPLAQGSDGEMAPATLERAVSPASSSSQLLHPPPLPRASKQQRNARRVRSSSPNGARKEKATSLRVGQQGGASSSLTPSLETEVLPAPPSLPYDILYAPLAPPPGIDPKLLAQAGIPVANLSALSAASASSSSLNGGALHAGGASHPHSPSPFASAAGLSPITPTSMVVAPHSASKMKRLAAKQKLQSHMASEKRGQMPMPWGLRTTILDRKRANGTIAKTRMGTMKRFPPLNERVIRPTATGLKGSNGDIGKQRALPSGARSRESVGGEAGRRRNEALPGRLGHSNASEARADGASGLAAQALPLHAAISPSQVADAHGTMKNGVIQNDGQTLESASLHDLHDDGESAGSVADANIGGVTDSQATTPVVPLLEIYGDENSDSAEDQEGRGGAESESVMNGESRDSTEQTSGSTSTMANTAQRSGEKGDDETTVPSSPFAGLLNGSRTSDLPASSEGADAEDASFVEMDLAAVTKKDAMPIRKPTLNGTSSPVTSPFPLTAGADAKVLQADAAADSVKQEEGVPEGGKEIEMDVTMENAKPNETSGAATTNSEEGPSVAKKRRGRPLNAEASSNALRLHAEPTAAADPSSSLSEPVEETLTRRPRNAHKRIRLSGGYYNKNKATAAASPSPDPSSQPSEDIPAMKTEDNDVGDEATLLNIKNDADVPHPAETETVVLRGAIASPATATRAAVIVAADAERGSTPGLIESSVTPSSTKSLRGMSGKQSSSPSKLIHASRAKGGGGGGGGGRLRGVTRASSTASSTSKATPTRGNHGAVAAAISLDDTSGNNEFCDTCEGRGHFICCDGCPRSFHFNCVNPPLEIDELPEGEQWFCRVCRAEKGDGKSNGSNGNSTTASTMSKKRKGGKGVFDALLRHTEANNPTIFSLPLEIRNYFKGVATSADGSYTDSSMLRPIKLNKAGFVDERDPYRLKDRNGKTVLCYRCGGSALPQDGIPTTGGDGKEASSISSSSHKNDSNDSIRGRKGGAPGRKAARRALSMIANPEASSIAGKGRESSAQEAIESSSSSTDLESHSHTLGEASTRQRREEQGWRKMVSCDFCTSHWHLDCVGLVPLTGLPSLTRKWMCPNHTDHVLRPDRIPKNVANAMTVYDLPVPSAKTIGAGKHYRTRVVNDGLIDIIPDPLDTFFGEETGAGRGSDRGWDAAPGLAPIVADAAPVASTSSSATTLAASQANNNAKLKFRIPEKVIRLDWWHRVEEDRRIRQQQLGGANGGSAKGQEEIKGGALRSSVGQSALVSAGYNGLDLLAVIAAANTAAALSSTGAALSGHEGDNSVFVDGTSPADLVRLALTSETAPRYVPAPDDPKVLPNARLPQISSSRVDAEVEDEEDVKWWKEGDEERSSIRSSFRPGEWEDEFSQEKATESSNSFDNTAPSTISSSQLSSSNHAIKKDQRLPDDVAISPEEAQSLRAVRQLLQVKGSQKLLDFLMTP